MNHKKLLVAVGALAPLLLAPALVAWMPAGDSVSFHAEDGLSLTRAFVNETHLSLDDMEMTMNGQPFPMEIEMDMTMDMSSSYTISDTYESVAEGRPNKLLRSFDSLTQHSEFSVENDMMPDGGMENSVDAQSELEGKTVAFAWDEDEGAFAKSYEEGDGDDELLEDLEEDMDMRALLPSGDVSEGDTWEIDVKSLKLIMSPGGNLQLKPDDDAMAEFEGMPGMDNMSDMNSMFDDLIQGEATGEYKGSREIEGVNCGVIELTLDISASADLTDKVAEAMGDELPEGMGEMEIEHMDFEVEFEGKGTLHWDLAAGVPHSFELTGETRMLIDMGFAISMGEQSMNMEQSLEMSGSFSNDLTITKD